MDYTEKKVFIIENGEYKEIPYSDFEERMAANTPSEEEKASGVKPLIERFFILIDDALLEVTHEQYIDYHCPQLRENNSLRHACGVPPPSKREANNGSLFEGAVGVADWGSA